MSKRLKIQTIREQLAAGPGSANVAALRGLHSLADKYVEALADQANPNIVAVRDQLAELLEPLKNVNR